MRRTPLQRGQPLKRGAPLRAVSAPLRRTRLRKRGKRTTDEQNAAQAFRRAVLARGACERCGSRSALHAHHITPRSRAPAAWKHNPERNGACLCSECHEAVHFRCPPDRNRWIR